MKFKIMEIDQLKAHDESESESQNNSLMAKTETSFDQIFSIVPHYSFHQFLITMFGFYIGIIAGEVQVASVFFQVSTISNFYESYANGKTINYRLRPNGIPILMKANIDVKLSSTKDSTFHFEMDSSQSPKKAAIYIIP